MERQYRLYLEHLNYFAMGSIVLLSGNRSAASIEHQLNLRGTRSESVQKMWYSGMGSVVLCIRNAKSLFN